MVALLGATAFFVLSSIRPDGPSPNIGPASAKAAEPEIAQPAVWDPPVLKEMPEGTVRHVGGIRIGAPQTYEVSATVLGWLNEDNGILCVELGDGVLLGDIDARTGAEKSRPKDGEPDYAERLRGLRVLTGTTPKARGALQPDSSVRLILLPVGDGATLFIDSVVR